LNQMGSWIRTMRERHRMTQEDFIEALKHYYGKGIAKSTLSGWEGGQKNPPIEDSAFISALAKVFSVTTAEVLQGSGYELGAAYEGLDEPRRRLLEAYDSGDLERLVRLALIELDKGKERSSHRLDVDDNDEGAGGASDVTRAARR
jgi:transcriptional regulator with XRE-family HTH domain